MKLSSVCFFLIVLIVVQLVSIASAYDNNDGDQGHKDNDQGQDKKTLVDVDLSIGDINNVTSPVIDTIILPEEWPSPYYYNQRCSNKSVEEIIGRKVAEWVKKDKTVAPSLIRLFFHDCAVRGCDASVLLNHEGSERTAKASKTLRGFEVIDDIKAEIERECPKTVSCADILAATARDATVLLGGDYWSVPFGRKDGRVSSAAEADEIVPIGRESITTLLELFQSLGLDVSDLVILSGAHTIGRTSCKSVQPRLYNYKGSGKSDESIKGQYLNFLERRCRWESEYVELDAETPWKFDTMYYKNLENDMGLLSTDQLLLSDSRTSPIARALSSMPPFLYNQIFGASMTKLSKVIREQDDAEIRTDCNFVNSNNY